MSESLLLEAVENREVKKVKGFLNPSSVSKFLLKEALVIAYSSLEKAEAIVEELEKAFYYPSNENTNENCIENSENITDNTNENVTDNTQNDLDESLILFLKNKDKMDVEIVKLLLENGANANSYDKTSDPNNKEKSGNFALIIAIEMGYKKTIRVLLEHGADPDTKHINGDSAVLCAIKSENIEAAKFILEARLHKK
jgi:ankyrin repeat protein